MEEVNYMGISLKKVPVENGQFDYYANGIKVTVWTLVNSTLTIMK